MSAKPSTRVLVIEDDPAMAAGIVRGLRAAGFEVELATNGQDGARKALEGSPNIVVLDLMLPEQSGFDVLEALNGRSAAPVIIVTAKSELPERLRCFGLGAADFLAKPFWIEELVARIRARLRFDDDEREELIRWADAVVDLKARLVTVGGARVSLTKHEFDILAHLLRRPDRAISREQLAEKTLSSEDRDPRTVDSHIARVRKKLGPVAAEHIATVWGIGYRFEPGGPAR